MSSRSLNGGDLSLKNLEITNVLKVKDLTIDNLDMSNLDISENLTADTVHTQHLKCASNIDIEGSHSYVHVNSLIGINATVSNTGTIDKVVSTDVSTNSLLCGDATIENTVITGDLTVHGNIIHDAGSSSDPVSEVMTQEIKYMQIGGNAANVVETITLTNNTAGTTNYSVFPSYYYGYNGSGSGTYGLGAGSMSQITIANRTATGFTFQFSKSTGDNSNIYVVFLIVYSSESDYPSSY